MNSKFPLGAAFSTVLALALPLVAGGCVSVLPKPAPAPLLFRLETAPIPAGAAVRSTAAIAVARPIVPGLIGGTDLILVRGATLSPLAGAAWAISAEEMLQDLLVGALTSAISASHVVRREAGAVANQDLEWRLMNFELVETETGFRAVFVADALLLETQTRLIIARKRLVTEASGADKSLSAAAGLLSEVAGAGAAAIAAFVREEVPPPAAAPEPLPQ